MSQPSELDELDRQLAAVPVVLPYAAKPACPKCGARDRITANGLWHGSCSGFDWGFCPGSRNEKTPIQVVPGVVVGEQRTACFGIFQEHLHMRCRRCGFSFLQETAAAKGAKR